MSKDLGLIIFLSLLVGGLYVAPQLIIRKRLADYGLAHVIIQTNNYSDEANVYAARGREVYDGHWPARDLYFDSRSPSIFPAIPSLLAGGFIYLASGDTDKAYLAMTFVFSALIFLLFCALGRALVQNKGWSVLIGLLGVLTPVALHLPRAFMSPGLLGDIVLKNFFPLVRTTLGKLFFGRADDPLITYLFYLPAIISLIWFWRRPGWARALNAGLWAGLLFHTYFHYAFYWAAVIVLMLLYVMFFRRADVSFLKYSAVVLVIALLVASPYFVEYFRFRSLPWSQDYVFRIGTEIGRGFRFASVKFDYLAYLFFAAAVYALLWRRGNSDQKNLAALFWIFLVAVFIVWNVQLLTGFVPHPSHWRKAISPLLFVILVSLTVELVRRLPASGRLRSGGAIVLIAVSALLIGKKVVNFLSFYQPPPALLAEYSFNPQVVNSWSWIRRNLPGEPRMVSDSFLTSVYLGVYTSARPFLPLGGNTPVANEKLEQNYLAANKIFGISANKLHQRLIPPADQNLSANLLDDPFYLYSSYWREKSFDYAFTGSSKSIPAWKVEELLQSYHSLSLDQDVSGASYLYYGPWEKEVSSAEPPVARSAELVYVDPEVRIYKLK